MKTLTKLIIVLLLMLSMVTSAQEVKNSTSGFLDFNIYPWLSDVDGDSVFTLNIGATIANSFSYFSLTNFSNQADRGAVEETSNYYTEQNIRWQLPNAPAFDLTAQLNLRSGMDNDRLRLGMRWRLQDSDFLREFFQTISLQWSINLHAIQIDHSDDNVWQLEHVFKLGFPSLSNRLYLAGFIDHTFGETLPDGFPSSPIVGEAQLGYRIVENLYGVLEYRINQYRRSDVNNLAAGIEYKIKW